MADESTQTRREMLKDLSKTGSVLLAGGIAGCSESSESTPQDTPVISETEEEVTNYVENVNLEDLPETAELGDSINLEGYADGSNLSSLTFQYREVGNEPYNNIDTKTGSGSKIHAETDFTAQDVGKYEFRVMAETEGQTENEHSRVSSSQIVEYLE